MRENKKKISTLIKNYLITQKSHAKLDYLVKFNKIYMEI